MQNLIAHKVAPALAAGCPIIIKAAQQTPGAARLLAEIFEHSLVDGVPASTLQVLNCDHKVAEALIKDDRVTTLSFTGSDKAGWAIQGMAIKKHCVMELGGSAGLIVCADADIERAASRCVSGKFGYAGQSCIAVQRVLVQESIRDEFMMRLVEHVDKLKVGDPHDEDTVVGPLIDDKAATRVAKWIEEAEYGGARVVRGGKRLPNSNIVQPTVLCDVPKKAKVLVEEVFGPVLVVETFQTLEEAIGRVNDVKYGLQAGIFTDSHKNIAMAIRSLDVGGVLVNEAPTVRLDQQPYGGVKDSGLGREGGRFAMEDYSTRKCVVEYRL